MIKHGPGRHPQSRTASSSRKECTVRIFVTGATGFIGSAVVQELLEAGHEVVGLARSDRAATALSAAGAKAHRGALDDLASLQEGAAAADGVVHLAYEHDFGDIAAAAATDLRAVEAIGAALEGCGKPFVVPSGTMAAPLGRIATERDEGDPASPGVHRTATEHAALALAERGVRSSVVRLAPSVHGPGDHGFIPALIGIARTTGISAMVGDGANRWPAVHRRDAAHLFRLPLESAPPGSRLHGVADEGVPFRDIAGFISRHLDVPVACVPREHAGAQFGWLAALASSDNPASSETTQQLLGWLPVHRALLPDLEAGHYFADQTGGSR
jgi:nucleoside-diphosphate-sugar epimerase